MVFNNDVQIYSDDDLENESGSAEDEIFDDDEDGDEDSDEGEQDFEEDDDY